MDTPKRRAAARKEILDATALIDVARRGIYGVPELFVARVEMAVARLTMLERVDIDPPVLRAPGRIEFDPPLAAIEPPVRTRKRPRRA